MNDVNQISMQTVQSVFKEALAQTISNYAEKSRTDIRHLILHICCEVRPYMIGSKSGAESLSDEIFTIEVRRDFIFNLLFNFSSRLSFSETEKEFSKLINSLSFSLAITDKVNSGDNSYKSEDNVLPSELAMRLPHELQIRELLKANKWLVMVLLISLYISVEDFENATSKT